MKEDDTGLQLPDELGNIIDEALPLGLPPAISRTPSRPPAEDYKRVEYDPLCANPAISAPHLVSTVKIEGYYSVCPRIPGRKTQDNQRIRQCTFVVRAVMRPLTPICVFSRNTIGREISFLLLPFQVLNY